MTGQGVTGRSDGRSLALAKVAVGIAMGTATDIAMGSAQVTLVKGDLRGIIRARTLSLATVQNIHQNLWFAFGYNAIGIPLAAFAARAILNSASNLSLSSYFMTANCRI